MKQNEEEEAKELSLVLACMFNAHIYNYLT